MLRIPKHLLGKKTAETPRTQIMLKIEPTTGFRHGTSSVTAGGKMVSNTIRNKPRKDTSSGYRMSDFTERCRDMIPLLKIVF